MMQPMIPPATGPTGALLIMFSVITSSPSENKRTDVRCQDPPSAVGGRDGGRAVRQEGPEEDGLFGWRAGRHSKFLPDTRDRGRRGFTSSLVLQCWLLHRVSRYRPLTHMPCLVLMESWLLWEEETSPSRERRGGLL